MTRCRCIPQVHGICIDTIQFVKGILETEMNSATDNPMVFSEKNMIISGGNFHGEYPAKAMDYLAIGIHEYGNISEVKFSRNFVKFSWLFVGFLSTLFLVGFYFNFLSQIR